MTISSIDGLIAGLKPLRHFNKGLGVYNIPGHNYVTSWNLTGIPGPGSLDSTLNGVTLTGPVNGGIPFTDAPGGQSTYLAKFQQAAESSVTGAPMLCDRLWHNGGISATSTSAQTITSPTWPARDSNGATLGDGVVISLEVTTIVGSGTPTITLGYTNSAGTAGRTASVVGVANAAEQTAYIFPLQGNDAGVRSVQSLTLSTSWTAGTINLVAMRVLAQYPCATYSVPGVNPISGGMTPLYNGSVLFPMVWQAAFGRYTMHGQVGFAQG